MDLFSNSELYQVFNFYRHPDRARGEKVLRTFGSMEHCEKTSRNIKAKAESGLKQNRIIRMNGKTRSSAGVVYCRLKSLTIDKKRQK